MLRIILKNGVEIDVKDGSTLFDIMVEPSQYSVMWENLTEDNLKLVKLTTDSGLIDQTENLVVDSERSECVKENIVCHFYLREKTTEELLREKVAFLEEQLAVHDGAINDLGTAMSDLAEGGLS